MTIRLATTADAEAIAAIYAPVVRDTATSFEIEPPTAGEMAQRIEGILVRYPWLVAEADGVVLGYAYAGAHRNRTAYQWSAEVSVYVTPEAHRRGVARRLYIALLDLLRMQGIATALAGITLPNAASVGVHEAMGFRLIGRYPAVGFKHGTWHDTGWWALRLGDGSVPDAPRWLSEIRGEVEARLAETHR